MSILCVSMATPSACFHCLSAKHRSNILFTIASCSAITFAETTTLLPPLPSTFRFSQ